MKKTYSFRFTLTLMLAASALVCMATALIFIRLSRPDDEISVAARNYRMLLELIDDVYIGRLDVGEVSDAAMRETVEALGDRWSYYLTSEEYAVYLDRANNRYAGIGIGVVIDDATGGMKVQYTYKGSAAESAGLAAGDIITEIDGESICGMDLDEMRSLIARPLGESVILTVLSPDDTTKALTVLYDYIFIDPVSYEMLDGDIGYIILSNFDTGSSDSFISAANELIGQGARAFVFDVRANNGGRVDEMTGILDYLLPEGEIFVDVDRNGVEDITLSGPAFVDMPAIVIVDANSYSAAEYFAATLREYGYAEVVGVQTTGKNRVQKTWEMPWGGALHISSSQYLTKNRVSLYDAGGLTPDHQVGLTEEEYAMFMSGILRQDTDPQLQKALSLLGAAPK